MKTGMAEVHVVDLKLANSQYTLFPTLGNVRTTRVLPAKELGLVLCGHLSLPILHRLGEGSGQIVAELEMPTELSHGNRLGVRSWQAGAGGPSYPRRAQLWNQEASEFKFWCHNFSVMSMS